MRRPSPLLFLVVPVALLGFAACSDETTPAPNAPTTAGDAGTSPSTCAPPAIDGPNGCDVVATLDCPAGKTPRIGSEGCSPVGNTTCGSGFASDPSGWGCAPTLPAKDVLCTGATRAALGQTACAPVSACAPLPAATGTTVVVDPAAVEDANHAKTITGALGKVAAGGTIAIAAGTYTEALTLSTPVTVVGTCASEVTIAGVTVSGSGATVRNVRIRSQGIGVDVGGSAKVTIEDAVIEDAVTAGVRVAAASTLVLRRSVVRKTAPTATDTNGNGVHALANARVELEDVTLTENREGAVRLDRGASAKLTRVVAHDTKPNSKGRGGIGLMSLGATDVAVTASAFVRNAETGILVEQYPNQPAITFVVEDSVVSDTVPWTDDFEAKGQYAGWNVLSRGGVVTLRRTTLARAKTLSLVSAQGAKVTVEDTTIREALDDPGGIGQGLVGAQDAEVTLTRAAVIGSRGIGVFVGGNAKGTVVESLVADTRGKAREQAIGIEAAGGAEVAVRRSAVLRFASMGIRVADLVGFPKGGSATVEDSIVADGLGYADGTFGRGIEADKGTIRLVGSLVHGAREGAIVSLGGSSIAVERSVIRATKANSLGLGGRGVQAQKGASVELSDSVVRDNRDVGVFVAQANTKARLVRTRILGTQLADAKKDFGHGLVVMLGATSTLDDCTIAKNSGVGLVISSASGSVRAGAFLDNPVALHATEGTAIVEVADVNDDVAENELQVTTSTRFDGNATRLGSGDLALPSVDLGP